MSVARVLRALGLVVAAVLALLLAVTVLRVTDGLTGSPTALRTGTANVVSCTEYGPVSQWGFGASHGCTADVRWSDGDTERLEFVPGQLAPGERGVPVFLSSSGRAIAPSPGLNDSAALVPIGVVGGILLALLTLWLALAAVIAVVRLFTGKHTPAPRKRDTEWPVTEADIAAVSPSKGARRLRLIGVALGLAVVLGMIGTYAQFDAPRSEGGFVSPWPQVAESWLTGVPNPVFVVVGLLLLLLCLVIAAGARKETARVVRYGEAYLLRLARNKKQRTQLRSRFVDEELDVSTAKLTSRLIGVLLFALGVWAAFTALTTLPLEAPLPARCGAMRDTALLLGAGVAWLVTVQPKGERIRALLDAHQARTGNTYGTTEDAARS